MLNINNMITFMVQSYVTIFFIKEIIGFKPKNLIFVLDLSSIKLKTLLPHHIKSTLI